MSLEMMVWALKKDLKNSDFKAMIYIANEADSSGVCYTGQEKLAAKSGLGLRTLQGSISRLRKMDLLHTERRPAEFARGRKVDAIILHPQNADWELPQQLQDAEEIREFRRLRDAYEVIEEPVDNLVSDLPAKSAGKYESPSQTQGAESAGKSFNPQKTDVQPAKMSRSTRKNEQPAFNRNARAFNPINPVNPSVSPVLNSTQEPPVEKTQTDGLTDRGNPEEEPSPITSEPISSESAAPELPDSASEAEVTVVPGSAADAPQSPASASPAWITRGVNHTTLRQELHQAQLETTGISEKLLAQMITIVFSRATQPVRSPQRFAYSCIAKEFYELLSLAQATLAETQDPAATGTTPAPKRAKPSWCQLHNREYTSAACPVCSNPRIAALEEPQNSLLVAQTPKEDPPSGAGIPLKRP